MCIRDRLDILDPKTITSVAPRAAPADTPIKPGSANGFLNRPCNAAPEIPRLAPTRAAKITLGSLISMRTILVSSLISPLIRFPMETFILPVTDAIKKQTQLVITKTLRIMICLDDMWIFFIPIALKKLFI